MKVERPEIFDFRVLFNQVELNTLIIVANKFDKSLEDTLELVIATRLTYFGNTIKQKESKDVVEREDEGFWRR